jgi:quercetin 2,3-dioxygenase
MYFQKNKIMATTVFHSANERGHADHGWLNAHHSFSFAGYHDDTKVHFGALRVLNDDIVQGGMGFGKHPHDNMEIITIVLDGALAHKDSMGNGETIHQNEVQVMSAGTGIFHSEFNPDHRQAVNLLQCWIFPNKRNVTPRYEQALFAEADRLNRLQPLVSPIDSTDAGLKIHQDAWIYRSHLQGTHTLDINTHNPNSGLYIFVIDGSVTVAGQTLHKRDAIGITETTLTTITAEADSDFIVFEVPMQF